MSKEHITTKKPCVAINDGSFFISASLYLVHSSLDIRCKHALTRTFTRSKFKVASIFVTNEAFPQCANFHPANAINGQKKIW